MFFRGIDESGALMATRRQMAMVRTLRSLAPLIPHADALDVLARAGKGTLRELAPAAGIWLALTSHVRHRYTDYDNLLGEGYDRDAARFFVIEATEQQLAEWGCTRPLIEETEAS
ncbi:MAG: DUF2293 domain-containing protein [Beijerinckiaceae bacterium]|jgi:hypothetical protein|nr:DUF2293 domain-containing protein [Beijerinckiaceae bacterium]